MTTFQPGDRVRYTDSRGVQYDGTVLPHATMVHLDVDHEDDAFIFDAGEAETKLVKLAPRPEPTDEGCGECDDCASGCVCGSRECETPEPDTPATDPIGTVRVHPDDDPEDPNARRVVRIDHFAHKWSYFTGGDRGRDYDTHKYTLEADWPRQSLADVARVLGHQDRDFLREAATEEAASELLARQECEVWEQAHAEALDRAERLERERDDLTRKLAGADERANAFRARAEEAEDFQHAMKVAERKSQRQADELTAKDAKIRDLKDKLDRIIRTGEELDDQHASDLVALKHAETRASSWWEVAKGLVRERDAAVANLAEQAARKIDPVVTLATLLHEVATERDDLRAQLEPKFRVFRDECGDRWYEQADGTFTVIFEDGAVAEFHANYPLYLVERNYGPLVEE